MKVQILVDLDLVHKEKTLRDSRFGPNKFDQKAPINSSDLTNFLIGVLHSLQLP